MTNEQLIKQWLQYCRGSENLSAGTMKRYVRYLKAFLKFTKKPIPAITKEDIEEYIINMVNSNYHINTRRLHNNSIRKFFSWYSRAYMAENPSAGIRPIQRVETSFNMVHPEDFIRIISYMNRRIIKQSTERARFRYFRNTAIIAFLGSTGVRVSELIRLSIDDIRIVDDKHHRKFEVTIPPLKTKKQRRFEFAILNGQLMSSEVFSAYWLYLTVNCRRSGSEPLFPSTMNWPELTYYPYTTPIQIMLKTIGKKLHIKMNAHAFRHFYGTYSTLNGMNIHQLKYNMGHSSIATTEKYIHEAERRRDIALKHSAMANIKAPKEISGFVDILNKII